MGILCILFLLYLDDGAFFWVVSDIQAPPGAAADWSMATTSGQWLSALLGAGVLGAVGMLPGAIAWYTRPRED